MEIPIMAHFAELDSNNIVLRVLVVDNKMIIDEQGNEVEQLGINFLKSLFGQKTIWLQTSYSGNFRKNYAGIEYTYDQARDAFINPKPIVPIEDEQYVTFDESTCTWNYNPPINKSEIGVSRV
jgi:hypothetical protein